MATWKLVFSTFLFVLLAMAHGSDGDRTGSMDVFRLPADTRPESYDLRFEPNFDGINSTFAGLTKIVIAVESSTFKITLNLKDLNVINVTVTDITNVLFRDVAVTDLMYKTHNEQFEIRLNRPIPAGRKLLATIAYWGKIRTDMSGLYLSSYDEGNVTKWLAVTQFESCSARKAFPCYDEPAYKTTYNVSIAVKKNQSITTCLSNMPVSKIDSLKDTVVYNFEPTPPMSSYLVAIYVGEFVPDKNDSDIKIYTQRNYINQTRYIGNDVAKYLNVLANYTGIQYMLPKMDLLAIPDFLAGAMENWGLNTYREYFLLLHEESKTRMKIRAVEVVQHEFTHQWFGDLVTCSWWDYTWLNEGFARYFQYFAAKMVKTNWQMEELFVVETHQGSMAYDQTPRHPITASVNSPSEIDGIFDTITYSKAASVLRMLKYLVTEKYFQKSLQEYLNNNKHNSAKPEQLYSAFDNVLLEANYELGRGLTVQRFMSNWTLQSGYPVLSIKKNTTSNTFSVIQSRFLVNATEASNSSNPLWIIGLTYTTNMSKNFSYTQPSKWMQSKITELPAPQNSGWYIFNIQSTGFYRVNYDIDNWNALIKQLNDKPSDIHLLNRAQLIDDSFALALAGQLNYSLPLSLSKYLKKEDSVIPWYSVKNSFAHLIQRMPRDKQGYASIKAHASRLAGIIFKKLDKLVSYKNTEFNVTSAWDTFSSWACSLDNEDCTSRALEYFKKWQAGEKIPADIKDAAFCVGVKNSTGSETFNKMFKVYMTTMSISEKMSAESALGCSANKTQLIELINHILDGPRGPIKPKDYSSIVSAISVTPLGLQVLYEFLSTNLNRTLTEVSNGEEIVNEMYSTLASKITTDYEIQNLRTLKDNNTLPNSVRKSFEKSFEKVNHNLMWFDSYASEIKRWATQNEAEELKEDQKTSTVAPVHESSSTTTVRPGTSTSSPKPTSQPSGAPSLVQNVFVILPITILLLKTFIL